MNGSEVHGHDGTGHIGEHLAAIANRGKAQRITSGEALARMRGLAVRQGLIDENAQDIHIAEWLKAAPAEVRGRLDAAIRTGDLQPSLMRDVLIEARKAWVTANKPS